jgi:murein DD-endopeptidase MepM/ murein hydrolase activator NlpD
MPVRRRLAASVAVVALPMLMIDAVPVPAAAAASSDVFQQPLSSWSPHCLGFGSQWRYCNGVALRACPSGAVWLHTGVDIKAIAGQAVMAAGDGVIVGYIIDPQFHGGVLIRHRTTFGVVLTQYWHVWLAPGFAVGSLVSRGQVFANIASMGDKTHFHFAVFRGDFESNAWRGALPPTPCSGFPAFPYRFTDPNAFLAAHQPLTRIGVEASEVQTLRRQIQPVLDWLFGLI